MTITVDIPKDIEQKIQQSISRGDTQAARQLLFETISPTIEACIINHADEPPELSYDEFIAQLNKLVEMASQYIDPNCPPLSDYAVSREGLYSDHL